MKADRADAHRPSLRTVMMDDLPQEPAADKPRYVLPEGCRDLLDWIRWQEADAQRRENQGRAASSPTFTYQEIVLPKFKPGAPMQVSREKVILPLPSKVSLSEPVQVGTLASKLGLKPYHLIENLIARKIFRIVDGWINFTTAAAICAELGVMAEKEDSGGLPL